MRRDKGEFAGWATTKVGCRAEMLGQGPGLGSTPVTSDARSGRNWTAEPVGEAHTCIGGDSDAGNDRKNGWIEVLQCLAGESFCDQQIHRDVETALCKWTRDGGTEFFYRNADALHVRVGVTACAERLCADVFEFALGLQMKGQFLCDAEGIEDGARGLCCGLS